MAGHLVTGAGAPDTVVAVQPGMHVRPVVLVTFAGALVTAGTAVTTAPGLVTGASPANAVVTVRPGMNVLPVVVVDGTGAYVYA
jgi:hypothetical protein